MGSSGLTRETCRKASEMISRALIRSIEHEMIEIQMSIHDDHRLTQVNLISFTGTTVSGRRSWYSIWIRSCRIAGNWVWRCDSSCWNIFSLETCRHVESFNEKSKTTVNEINYSIEYLPITKLNSKKTWFQTFHLNIEDDHSKISTTREWPLQGFFSSRMFFERRTMIRFNQDWTNVFNQSKFEEYLSVYLFFFFHWCFIYIGDVRISMRINNERVYFSVPDHWSSFTDTWTEMVQRLTYRRRLSYNTKSNRVKV